MNTQYGYNYFQNQKKQKGLRSISIFSTLLLLMQLFLSGIVLAFAPVSDARAEAVPDLCEVAVDVVLVMDRSGSMGEEGARAKCEWWESEYIDPSWQWVEKTTYDVDQAWCDERSVPPSRLSVYTPAVNNKLQDSKLAADYFLSLMGAGDQSALVSFADSAVLEQALSNNHAQTQAKVAGLTATGATNIKDALLLGNSELRGVNANPQAIKAMILLTDGKANKPNGDGSNENAQDVSEALDQAYIAAAAGYKIFTIGLGSDVSAAMLGEIAASTGASYYFAPSSADLEGIYESIRWELCKYGSISGCKYNDLNNDAGRNGIDIAEPKISDWEILLANGVSTTTQRTINGCYTFAGLNDGTYTVSEVLSGAWQQTYPASGSYSVEISNHNNISNIDFANFLPATTATGSITIIKDDINNSGTAFAFSGDLGDFSLMDNGYDIASTSKTFSDLATGTYLIYENATSGWTLDSIVCTGTDMANIVIDSASSSASITLAENEEIACTFANTQTQATSTISGYKFRDYDKDIASTSDWIGIENWTIALFDANASTTYQATTSADGYFEFKNLQNGVYAIAEVLQAGWQQLLAPLAEIILVGKDSTNNNFVNYFPFCGNGIVDDNESCDDGNTASGDGCSATCQSEGNGGQPYCGNGIKETGEECDGADVEAGYTCLSDCTKRTRSSGGIFYYPTLTQDIVEEAEEVMVLGEEGAPVLEITKTVNKQYVNQGEGDIEYTVKVANTGSLSAFNTELKDVLPLGLTYQDDGKTEREWALGDLAAGSSKEIKFTVKAGASAEPKEYVNTIVAKADNHEEISASATIEVRKIEVLAETGFSNSELLFLSALFAFLLALSYCLRKAVAIARSRAAKQARFI